MAVAKRKAELKQDAAGFFARPLCPFCSKPWSDEMIQIFDISHSAGCDTCGHGSKTTVTINITCDGCKRIIYSKEAHDR
jgi:hypothetical protein